MVGQSDRLASVFLCVLLISAFLPAVMAIPTSVSTLPSGYRTREALLQDFFNLMNEYPSLMTYESIGKSYQGRDIPMFMIGNPKGDEILFTMATHGDEIQGAEVGYYMAQWILQRTEPAIADRILANNLIMIVIVNIDSYGIKRKNMDMYGYVQGDYANNYGVDLNRNMPTGWGGGLSSSNVSDMAYKGPSPDSEPETQALMNLFQTYKPKFQLNYHYGGGMVFAKPSVNARMSLGMSGYHDIIANEIKNLAKARGVDVFGYGQLGIGGDITDQAYVSDNSTSYLLEAGNWPAPVYSQMQSVLLPELLPFLIVFSQESGIVQTPFDGTFESGDFSAWTGTSVASGGTTTVVNTTSYQGNYCAQFTSNGTSSFEAAFCYESIDDSKMLQAGGYFYVSQSGIFAESARFYLLKFQAGNVSVAYAGWRRVGGVNRWELTVRESTGWATAYSTSTPLLNNWYNVDLAWTEGQYNGSANLIVNGVITCSLSNQNTTGFGQSSQVRFGLAEVFDCNKTSVFVDSCMIIGNGSCDFNHDGKVDLTDLIIFANAFGSTPSSPRWNPAADLNGDGKVDLADFVLFALHYGE